MPNDSIVCPICHNSCAGLYALRTGGEACFPCLDAAEPETVDRYDGWRDREVLRERRAHIARTNFCRGDDRRPKLA